MFFLRQKNAINCMIKKYIYDNYVFYSFYTSNLSLGDKRGGGGGGGARGVEEGGGGGLGGRRGGEEV